MAEKIALRVASSHATIPRIQSKPSTPTGAATTLAAIGSSRPLRAPRASPMVEAMVAFVLADHLRASRVSAASGEERLEARVTGADE